MGKGGADKMDRAQPSSGPTKTIEDEGKGWEEGCGGEAVSNLDAGNASLEPHSGYVNCASNCKPKVLEGEAGDRVRVPWEAVDVDEGLVAIVCCCMGTMGGSDGLNVIQKGNLHWTGGGREGGREECLRQSGNRD